MNPKLIAMALVIFAFLFFAGCIEIIPAKIFVTPTCGNGLIEVGENCKTCPQDMVSTCEKEKESGLLFLTITSGKIAGIEEFELTVSDIEVHRSMEGLGWIKLNTEVNEVQKIDLIKLAGQSREFASKRIELGRYDKIRVLFEKAIVKDFNGNSFLVSVPGEKFELQKFFSIEEDKYTGLILDFLPESLQKEDEKFVLNPKVNVLTAEEFVLSNAAQRFCIDSNGIFELKEQKFVDEETKEEVTEKAGYCKINGIECGQWDFYNGSCPAIEETGEKTG